MEGQSQPAERRLGRVLVNHLGFACAAVKQVIVAGGHEGDFELEDMALIRTTAMGSREAYQAVLRGKLRRVDSALGAFSVGDFSDWATPGVYRVTLPSTGEHSYQFTVTDGAYGWLPPAFLGFVRSWRSGPFENAWRGPSHLDDARRTDDGAQADASGGWYDAGDTRKWMVHSNLPALAFMDAHENIPWQFAEWERVDEGWSPWLLEARWGIDFILRMQEPATGLFYEDVGGGGNARKKPGMAWWYENHAGCYADNADNRFTDNLTESGDERPVRIQYNPIAQFTSVAILARAAKAYAGIDPERSRRCADAAALGWRLGLAPDAARLESPGVDFGSWTSVRSWRALAALELNRCGLLAWTEVAAAAALLIDSFDSKLGFWMNVAGGREPYRGILHSAQPLIALARISEASEDPRLRASAEAVLRTCLERYVYPLSETTPFGIIPFGAFLTPASAVDLHRPWRDGYTYRHFMPEHHPQRINHGLGGHWTSWSHALALVGRLLSESRVTSLAWCQIHWLIGCNPFNASAVSGVGYNNPMPHSRFLGTLPGGFCTGFNGTADDRPQLDLEGDAQWNTTEYWMTPLSNTVMALALLNPRSSGASRKLGRRAKAN